MHMRYLIIPIFLVLLLQACNTSSTDESVTTDSTASLTLPDFNGDSSYAYTKAQLDFGPRIIGTQAHAQCAAYLATKLKQFGWQVQIQKAKVSLWNGDVVEIKNIIATYKPELKNRILLCAHWDSRPTADHDPDKANWNKPVPGANDGAGSVAVLLEIARQMQLKPLDLGADIVLFDAEDYGMPQFEKNSKVQDDWALGSQYWAKNPHVAGYTARFGMLLDMVSAANATFYMEGVSMQYAPDIMRKVWQVAYDLGFSNTFINMESSPVTDDHLYVNKYLNIPTIDIIHRANTETGFYPYWHTVNDDINAIDKNTQQIVGQTILAVLQKEQ